MHFILLERHPEGDIDWQCLQMSPKDRTLRFRYEQKEMIDETRDPLS
jgi:hypothetical protein